MLEPGGLHRRRRQTLRGPTMSAARRRAYRSGDFQGQRCCVRVPRGHGHAPDPAERGTMRNLQDVDGTVIEIDSDGDGLSDEELVIVEDAAPE